jgi:predicted AlkP superfamily phosphohydrolase/phosphomutase
MKYCNTETTNTQKRHSYVNTTSYPVTPPEGRALELPEFWDMLSLKRKNFTNAFRGRTTPTHPTKNNNNQQTTSCLFQPSSVELVLFSFVWFVSIYKN